MAARKRRPRKKAVLRPTPARKRAIAKARPRPSSKPQKKRKHVPKRKVQKVRPKPKAPKRVRRRRAPSPAQKAAVTRAENRFKALALPRSSYQARVFEERRAQLAGAYARSGFSKASVRSRIGWITRRRNERFRSLAVTHQLLIGHRVDAKGEEGRNDYNVLQAHLRERSQAFQEYIDRAEDLHIDFDTAVDFWFSPEAG